jgi:hypothetical protein
MLAAPSREHRAGARAEAQARWIGAIMRMCPFDEGQARKPGARKDTTAHPGFRLGQSGVQARTPPGRSDWFLKPFPICLRKRRSRSSLRDRRVSCQSPGKAAGLRKSQKSPPVRLASVPSCRRSGWHCRAGGDVGRLSSSSARSPSRNPPLPIQVRRRTACGRQSNSGSRARELVHLVRPESPGRRGDRGGID